MAKCLDLIIKHLAVSLLICAPATCCTAGTMCQSLFFFFLLQDIYHTVNFVQLLISKETQELGTLAGIST